MKIRYLFLLLILPVFSCSRDQKTGTFTIHGQFSDSRGEKIVLYEMDVSEVVALDSANTDIDGKVNFSSRIDQAGFYLLEFPDGRRVLLVIDRGEEIFIRGNSKDKSGDLRLSGSPASQLLEQFFHETLKNRAGIDSVKQALKRHEGSDDFLRFSMAADSLFFRISGNQKKLEKEFIDRNPLSLASLIVLNYSFGQTPVLTLEEDLPYYQKLTGLYRIYPKNKHVLYHLARVRLFMNSQKNPEN